MMHDLKLFWGVAFRRTNEWTMPMVVETPFASENPFHCDLFNTGKVVFKLKHSCN